MHQYFSLGKKIYQFAYIEGTVINPCPSGYTALKEESLECMGMPGFLSKLSKHKVVDVSLGSIIISECKVVTII